MAIRYMATTEGVRFMRNCLLLTALILGLACGTETVSKSESGAESGPVLKAGRWRAVLHSPGGELPFGLTLSHPTASGAQPLITPRKPWPLIRLNSEGTASWFWASIIMNRFRS